MTKIGDILNSDTKKEMQKKDKRRRNKNKSKKDPLKEKLSPREWKELMWNGDTYGRGKGGAIRRK